MVVGLILKFGGLAAGFIFFGLFAKRSVEIGIGPAAKEVADSIGSFGKGIGNVGTGFAALGTGIGSGISGLFAPFITLFNLFGGGGNQATSQNSALKPAAKPMTNQQSNTRASKAASFGIPPAFSQSGKLIRRGSGSFATPIFGGGGL